MNTQRTFEVSQVDLDRIEHRMAQALAEIVMICDPPQDKLDQVNDLVCSVLGEIDMIKSGS